MRILLVDDERLVRFSTESMLRQLLVQDFSCIHASGAAKAEAWVAANGAPDMAFIDYKMPLCNGVELVKRLRGKCPGTVWILLSGYDMTANTLEITEAGIQHILLKPASVRELQQVLEKCGVETRQEADDIW